MDAPPHKYLFHCYMYEYHTMQLGLLLSGLVSDGASDVGESMPNETNPSWTRSFGWSKSARRPDCGIRHFPYSCCFGGVNGVRRQIWIGKTTKIQVCIKSARCIASSDVSMNIDVIQGIEPEMQADLGMARRRNPDALPPSNAFESVMYWAHNGLSAFASGNTVFAVKAGLLTGTELECVAPLPGSLMTSRSTSEPSVLPQELSSLRVQCVFCVHPLYFRSDVTPRLSQINTSYGECGWTNPRHDPAANACPLCCHR